MQNILLKEYVRNIRNSVSEISEATNHRSDSAWQMSSETEVKLLSTTLMNANESVYLVDEENRIRFVNLEFCARYGYTMEEIIGKESTILWKEGPAGCVPEEIVNGRCTTLEGEFEQKTKQGILFPAMLTRFAVWGKGGLLLGVITVIQDMSKQFRGEEEKARNIMFDKLTGLPGRYLFLDRIRQAMRHWERRRNSQFAVVCLSLERLRGIYESLGVFCGDHVVITAARRLESCVRSSDTVARISSNEFALLLDDMTSLGESANIADRIQESFAHDYHPAGNTIRCGISAGVALSLAAHSTPEEYLKDAKMSLLRNRYRIVAEERATGLSANLSKEASPLVSLGGS